MRPRQRAKRRGAEVIREETALDRAFASGNADVATVKRLVHRIADLNADLRLAHLNAHSEMRKLLSARQVAHYDRLRGYGPASGR